MPHRASVTGLATRRLATAGVSALFALTLCVLVLLLLLGAPASARADVVPVVSARSPVTTLTRDQLADIFLGRRARYPDGSAAVPIDQSEGSQARVEFYSRYTGMSPGQLKAFWSKIIFMGRGEPPRAVGSARQLKRLLAANQEAIAYLERSQVDASVHIVKVR